MKELKSGTEEGDRVKFLQEAAIMGQFRHPNVVTLHGMVTIGEPVSHPPTDYQDLDVISLSLSLCADNDCNGANA